MSTKDSNLEERCGVQKPLKDAKVKLKDCCVVMFDKELYKKVKPLLTDYDKPWTGIDVTVYNTEEPANEDDLGDNNGYDNLSYDSVGQF